MTQIEHLNIEHSLRNAVISSLENKIDKVELNIPTEIFNKYFGNFIAVCEYFKPLAAKHSLELSAKDNGGYFGHNLESNEYIKIIFIIDYEERERRRNSNVFDHDIINKRIGELKKYPYTPEQSYKIDHGIV